MKRFPSTLLVLLALGAPLAHAADRSAATPEDAAVNGAAVPAPSTAVSPEAPGATAPVVTSDRTAMMAEIDAVMADAQQQVAALVAQVEGATEEQRAELNRRAGDVKARALADAYLVQARYAREEGRTADAEQLEAIAERTVNPVLEVAPGPMRSSRDANN